MRRKETSDRGFLPGWNILGAYSFLFFFMFFSVIDENVTPGVVVNTIVPALTSSTAEGSIQVAISYRHKTINPRHNPSITSYITTNSTSLYLRITSGLFFLTLIFFLFPFLIFSVYCILSDSYSFPAMLYRYVTLIFSSSAP